MATIYECDQTPALGAVVSSSRHTSPATQMGKDASRSQSHHERNYSSVGEVRPSFSVSQNGDRAEVLHALQAYFGCGSIRPDRSDKTLKWETRRLEDLLGRVIPHFERYPLLSGKRYDFDRFASVCRLMADGAHLRHDGLAEIVELVRTMNPSGRRRYASEAVLAALRDKVKG